MHRQHRVGILDQPVDRGRNATSVHAAGRMARDVVRGVTLIEVRRVLRRRRRVLALAWLAVVVLAAGGVATSLAFFTSETPAYGPFTAGTISLGVAPTSTLITFAGMVPGSQAQGPLTVRNAGSGDLRYAMTATATDDDGKHLRDALQLDVERRTGCGGAVLETVYSGPIATAAFGNPNPGANAGDRLLAGGASEVLCFRATLPVGADSVLQGASTTVTLVFQAEQVSGNP
jgi:hypothetical protein